MNDLRFVQFSLNGAIAEVKLNRPEKHNGVNLELIDELLVVAKQLKSQKAVRAVVISGLGPSFCSGLDFASVGKRPKTMMWRFFMPPFRRANTYQRFAWAWRELPMPVIAAIHGNCFGAGIQLALACDFRICHPEAKLSVMEAKWGLVPDMSGTVALHELCRLDQAKRLVFTGEIISADRANELGLLTEIADEPRSKALELAEQLSHFSPDAIKEAKALLNSVGSRSERSAFKHERWAQVRLLLSKNHAIAKKAAFKKQTPNFLDRR